MRHILTTMMFFACISVFAQEKEDSKSKPSSNLEQFSNRAGRVIQREYRLLTQVKRCTLEILTITDLVTKETQKGLRFSYVVSSPYASTKTAFLDSDEVDGLNIALDLMKEKMNEPVPSIDTELVFTSRSGFSAGCYNYKNKWSAFMKLERYDSNSNIYLDKEDIRIMSVALGDLKGKL